MHALRSKPVDQFTPEDLETMIGQRRSLDVLVPYALGVLERDPLTNAFFYPGDLLRTVLARPPGEYWHKYSDQAVFLDGLVATVTAMGDLDDLNAPHDVIHEAIDDYHHRRPQG